MDTLIGLDDLRRLFRESAGADEQNQLTESVLDTDFEDLGYDSLALLETTARISREYGIRLDDDIVTSARTPRALLGLVNGA